MQNTQFPSSTYPILITGEHRSRVQVRVPQLEANVVSEMPSLKSAHDVRDTVIEELPASGGGEVVMPEGSSVAIIQEEHAFRQIGILPVVHDVST